MTCEESQPCNVTSYFLSTSSRTYHVTKTLNIYLSNGLFSVFFFVLIHVSHGESLWPNEKDYKIIILKETRF